MITTPPKCHLIGKAIGVPVCEVWQRQDGKIARFHVSHDNMTMLTQLGLLPKPANT